MELSKKDKTHKIQLILLILLIIVVIVSLVQPKLEKEDNSGFKDNKDETTELESDETNEEVSDHEIAEILYNQSIRVIYNEEAYVVEGLPETVDITLIGRKSDIYLEKQSSLHPILVDLSKLTAGKHNISLEYKQSIPSLTYKIDPSIISIVIYDKIAKTQELDYIIYNKSSLNKELIISDVKLSHDAVVIKGAEYKVEQVETVKAIIDINELSNIQIGEVNTNNVKLVAYDSQDKFVGVEIVPSKIDAVLTIIDADE